MKYLLLTTYPYEEPCARVRFLLLKNELRKNNIKLIDHSIFSRWLYFHKNDQHLAKKAICLVLLLWGIISRIVMILFWAPITKGVIIQKEAMPIGKIWVEKLIKLLNKNILFDFDDAIYTSPEHVKDWRPMQDKQKLEKLIRLAKIVTVGSEQLKKYALKYNQNVKLYFDSLELEKYPLKAHQTKNNYIIGWIGTKPNLIYLSIIKPALIKIAKEFDITFKIIGPKDTPQDILKGVKTEIIPWSKENEIKEILTFDIGVMPLFDSEWERGKSGYKLVQYMAGGIPFVASGIGMNQYFSQNEQTGFLAANDQQWEDSFRKLLGDANLRTKMGAKGRELVSQNNKLERNSAQLAKLLASMDNPKS